MFQNLDHEDRMRLMRFVCSFAWADLEVREEERDFVARLMGGLDLDAHERKEVERYLRHPPRPEEVDPQDIPAEHRQLLLLAVKAMVASDGEIAEGEAENLALLEQLLSW